MHKRRITRLKPIVLYPKLKKEMTPLIWGARILKMIITIVIRTTNLKEKIVYLES